MKQTLFKNLLADFKKANASRKMILAGRAGCSSVEEYEQMLLAELSEETVEKPTIHIVDIIDCSGSMAGGKIGAAMEGVDAGIEKLKEDSNLANYTYSQCLFSFSNDIKLPYQLVDVTTVKKSNFKAGGYTALNDAVGLTLQMISEARKTADEKVLVNIYTDGQENDSRKYSDKTIKELIKKLEDLNVTVTFVGMKDDVRNVIANFGVDVSNTAVYDGSAGGFADMMSTTLNARSVYTTNVAQGLDVKKGFYKNIKK